MSDTNGETTVKFVESHQPKLIAGEYSIAIEHYIATEKTATPRQVGSAEYRFYIDAPRFSLNPQDIAAVFPPAGSLGEHSNVLPHIQFQRSTLPWERQPLYGDKNSPWLALLVLHEDELGSGSSINVITQTVTLEKLGDQPDAQLGQHPQDPVNIIDIDAALLKRIFPDPVVRKWLAHVRNSTVDGRSGSKERAVIVGNRLPAANGGSIVHLVSIAGRDIDKEIADAKTAQKLRLITLYSWRFACLTPTHSFKGLLLNLNQRLRLEPETNTLVKEQLPGVLRLPHSKNADAEGYLKRGAVPLPHTTRLGNRTVSWYHGPFVPGTLSCTPIEFPIQAADQAVHYNESLGMLDVSYGAAWELGRLLTLQNKTVAAALYNWKRRHAQTEKLLEAERQFLHLGMERQSAPGDLPQNVADWFRDLSLLRAVPFRYLVPDEKMLPPESLRFFQIDPLWIQCLVDGAFSVGRVLAGDHVRDRNHVRRLPADLKPAGPASGLFLRSAVVSGWPDLLVDAYDSEGPTAKLREDKLSPNILLCLFTNVVVRVDIHQRPEALHFGFSRKKDFENQYIRVLRDEKGKSVGASVDVPISPEGVVDWPKLDDNITNSKDVQRAHWKHPVTSALLAFQLIEGVEQVRFNVK